MIYRYWLVLSPYLISHHSTFLMQKKLMALWLQTTQIRWSFHLCVHQNSISFAWTRVQSHGGYKLKQQAVATSSSEKSCSSSITPSICYWYIVSWQIKHANNGIKNENSANNEIGFRISFGLCPCCAISIYFLAVMVQLGFLRPDEFEPVFSNHLLALIS